MSDLLYLRFDVRGELLDAARQCEEDVFLQAFGNTREQLAEEYGPYNDQSVFMAVSDADGYVVGSCRLITPGPAGIKTLNDLSREPWGVDGVRSGAVVGVDPADTWDIATLGVRKDFRGSKMMIAIALYHGLVVSTTRANQIGSVTAILDDNVRRLLTAADWIMPTMPGTSTGEYLGSPASTPVYGHPSAMVDGQRRLNPDAYRLMTQGIGLDGIVVPDVAAFELRPVEEPVAPARPTLVPVAAA